MRLKRWDWDKAAFVEDDYPDALFQPFVEWFLTTNAWHEAHELVEAKVLKLQRALADHRNPPATHREADAPPVLSAEELKKQAMRERMAKARAARKPKAVTV